MSVGHLARLPPPGGPRPARTRLVSYHRRLAVRPGRPMPARLPSSPSPGCPLDHVAQHGDERHPDHRGGMCAVVFSGLSGGRRTVRPGAQGGATGRNRPRSGPEDRASGLRARAKCAGAGDAHDPVPRFRGGRFRPTGPDRDRRERRPPVSRCRPGACPRRKREEPSRATSASAPGAKRAPDPTRAPNPRACASGTSPGGSREARDSKLRSKQGTLIRVSYGPSARA